MYVGTLVTTKTNASTKTEVSLDTLLSQHCFIDQGWTHHKPHLNDL